ncbi:MAG: hypothetical protein K9L32_01970 [Chromatiaceae bacterium]|nr:hypothetical protein [Chromatiaceae bacterium]MCF8002968.1 hypothetical protein [Chromatiaceae bacterium]
MNPSALLPATQTIVQDLEAASHFPVSFAEEASLNVLASLSMATAQRPNHVLRYKPGVSALDYVIAAEAARAIRTFRHSPERRLRLAGAADARMQVAEDLEPRLPDVPDAQRSKLADLLFDGLLVQLLSAPVGILVDQALYREHPTLRPQQALSLEQQLQTVLQVLAPAYRQQFPERITHASRAINAAVAIASAELLRRPALAVAYRAAGLERIGLTLLAELPSDSNQVIDDPALISRWAELLDIGTWLIWVPMAPQ